MSGAVVDAKVPIPGASLDSELEMCALDPVYFAVRHCFTIDPFDGGKTKLVPPWKTTATYLDAFARRGNKLIPKSRKMMVSWLGPIGFLWKAAFRRNYSGIMASRKQSLVDDGGEGSTQDSLFGRLRLVWEMLDPDIRARIPLRFAFCRITNSATGASIRGEATGPNVGRAGTYDDALLDEAAYVPQSEEVHRSLHFACPHGKIYQSTPNGPGGMFARLVHECPSGYEVIRLHWTLHPERWDGEYDAETGRPTSGWYRDQCSGTLPDQIARELDISFEHSAHGLVYPEYSFDVHVRADVPYETDLPLWCGVDPGIGAPTAAVFFQVHGRELRIIGDYEMANTAVETNARNLLAVARKFGFSGEPKEIRMAMDPAANARDLVRGSTVIREYAANGFTNIATPRVKLSDGIRLVRRKLLRKEVFVAAECDMFSRRMAGYRYPVDDSGNVKGDDPVHDICSHMMDALRYGATSAFKVDDSGEMGILERQTQLVPIVGRRDDGRRFRHEDKDAFRPIMGQKRRF